MYAPGKTPSRDASSIAPAKQRRTSPSVAASIRTASSVSEDWDLDIDEVLPQQTASAGSGLQATGGTSPEQLTINTPRTLKPADSAQPPARRAAKEGRAQHISSAETQRLQSTVQPLEHPMGPSSLQSQHKPLDAGQNSLVPADTSSLNPRSAAGTLPDIGYDSSPAYLNLRSLRSPKGGRKAVPAAAPSQTNAVLKADIPSQSSSRHSVDHEVAVKASGLHFHQAASPGPTVFPRPASVQQLAQPRSLQELDTPATHSRDASQQPAQSIPQCRTYTPVSHRSPARQALPLSHQEQEQAPDMWASSRPHPPQQPTAQPALANTARRSSSADSSDVGELSQSRRSSPARHAQPAAASGRGPPDAGFDEVISYSCCSIAGTGMHAALLGLPLAMYVARLAISVMACTS